MLKWAGLEDRVEVIVGDSSVVLPQVDFQQSSRKVAGKQQESSSKAAGKQQESSAGLGEQVEGISNASKAAIKALLKLY